MKKQRQINSFLFIEPECRGFQHSEFNAAFISVVALAHPEASLMLASEQSHGEGVLSTIIRANRASLAKRIQLNTIEFLPVDAVGFHSWFQSLLESHLGRVQVIFTSVNKTNFTAMMALVDQICQPPWIVLHGILEDAMRRPSLRFSHWKGIPNWFGWVLRSKSVRYFKWITLSDSILQATLQRLPRLAPYLHSMDMPYLFLPSEFFGRGHTPEQGFSFATLGVMDLGKGAKTILQIAKVVKNTTPARPLQLIGFVNGEELYSTLSQYAKVPKKNFPMDRECFWEACREATHALFCFSANSYQYKSSAAFWDAICAELPILALWNPSFQHYARQFPLAIQLYDSVALLQEAVMAVMTHGDPQYTYRVEETKKMKQEYAIESYPKRLRSLERGRDV